MSSDPIFSSLNEAQQLAVLHPIGVPAMVIAGAGSGKTRVLTSRVSWLLTDQGVSQDEIMLVTFTNKAAGEMTKRVYDLTQKTLPYSGTFHRLCARILRSHGHHIGLSPGFAIYDEDDAQSLLGDLAKDLGLSSKEYRISVLLALISGAKNELISPEEYRNLARGKFQEAAARLYPQYQRALAKNDAVDFDDILCRVIELFEHHPEILSRYQQQFSHVLIDEYQDTNSAQLALTKLLFLPQRNLFVVGDFSQAIYGWRGADYRNMLSLKTSLPDLVTYELDQNYRSTQSILDAASAVISQNSTHPVLSLWTEQGQGAPVSLLEASDDSEEVRTVVSRVRDLIDTTDDHIAILYRTNAQSRSFEEGLLHAGIRYRLVGGVRFYARKEIKDLLAYVRLFDKPTDHVASARIQKIGKRKLAAYLQWVDSRSSTTTTETMLQILDEIIRQTQFLAQFDPQDEEDAGRLENISELRSVAANFSDITSFLESVALIEQEALAQQDDEGVRVTLMSIHAAKGLEFEHVFLVGMEEGLFPHSRSLMDPLQMEEERRLCYVAITRAKITLQVSYARRRLLYGRVTGAVVSRFVCEIPERVVKRVGMHRSSIPSLPLRPSSKERRFVPFDDPAIDDFLSGNLDVSDFLGR